MFSNGDNDDLQSYLKETKTRGSGSRDIDWSKLMESTELKSDVVDIDNNLLDEQRDINMFLKRSEDKKLSQHTRTHSARKKSGHLHLHRAKLMESSDNTDLSSVTSYTAPSEHTEEQSKIYFNLRNISDSSSTHTHDNYTQDPTYEDYTSPISETSATRPYDNIKQNVFSIDQLETMSDDHNPSLPLTSLTQHTIPHSEHTDITEHSIQEEHTLSEDSTEGQFTLSEGIIQEKSETRTEGQLTFSEASIQEKSEASIKEEYLYSDQFDSSVCSSNSTDTISLSGEGEGGSSGEWALLPRYCIPCVCVSWRVALD